MKGKLLHPLRRLRNRKKRLERASARQQYLEYYETLPIDETAVFLEARNGKEIDGNIYYILRELLIKPEYEKYRLYVSAEEKTADTIRDKVAGLAEGAPDRTEIMIVGTLRYYEIAATAKFIFSDATLQNFFIKKEGQIYTNVWHGTPFKTMGRRIAHEPHAVGNVQKNFTIADYLLYPNEYMMEHMVEDYMIANTSSARILLCGYPRNTAFFDEIRRKAIREELELAGNKIYVYMPTHRPALMGESLKKILAELDDELCEGEVLFAKIHPLAADDVDFDVFRNIKAFPGRYETYELLNIADCLITDYSSVFYDFAVTRKKIVLYTYDAEEYLRTRGLYEPFDSLPFTQVKTTEELMAALRSPKDYNDDGFFERFCSYDCPEATEYLCRRVMSGEMCEEAEGHLVEKEMPSNGRKNVMVCVDDLRPGAATDELMDYLKEADKEQYNWFITFRKNDVKDDKEVLLDLPEGIDYFGRAGKPYDIKDAGHSMHIERLRCFGKMPIHEIRAYNGAEIPFSGNIEEQ